MTTALSHTAAAPAVKLGASCRLYKTIIVDVSMAYYEITAPEARVHFVGINIWPGYLITDHHREK